MAPSYHLSSQYLADSSLNEEISQFDFGMDQEKYPMALKVWEKLQQKSSVKHQIFINNDTRGHAMSLWKELFNKILQRI